MRTHSDGTKLLMRTIDSTLGSDKRLKFNIPEMISELSTHKSTQHISAPAVNLALPTLIFTSLIKVIVVRLALNQRPASVGDDRGKYKASLTVMESS